MPIKVNFFDNTPYYYLAQDFNNQMGALFKNDGVLGDLSFNVNQMITPNNQIVISVGFAYIGGHFIYSSEPTVLTVQANDSTSTVTRYVCLVLDRVNGTANITVGANVTNDAILLARINIPSMTGTIINSYIVKQDNSLQLQSNLLKPFNDFLASGGSIQNNLTVKNLLVGDENQDILSEVRSMRKRDSKIIYSSLWSSTNNYTINSVVKTVASTILNVKDVSDNKNTAIALNEVGLIPQSSNTAPIDLGREGGVLNERFKDVWVGSHSKAVNGYSKLTNGMIIQWGRLTVPTATQTTVTYPILFPNQCYNIQVSIEGSQGTPPCPTTTPIDTASFKITHTSGYTSGIHWFAIGY